MCSEPVMAANPSLPDATPRSTRRKRLTRLAIALTFIVAALYWFALQFGLTNRKQEFGTYGQYNRVLRLVGEMDGYTIVNSQLSRRLDWRNLGYLDSFSVSVRDTTGKVSSIQFLRESDEMRERGPGRLTEIIRRKVAQHASRESH